MDGSAQNVAQREQDEHDGAEFDAKNHANDGTDSGDVQQLD